MIGSRSASALSPLAPVRPNGAGSIPVELARPDTYANARRLKTTPIPQTTATSVKSLSLTLRPHGRCLRIAFNHETSTDRPIERVQGGIRAGTGSRVDRPSSTTMQARPSISSLRARRRHDSRTFGLEGRPRGPESRLLECLRRDVPVFYPSGAVAHRRMRPASSSVSPGLLRSMAVGGYGVRVLVLNTRAQLSPACREPTASDDTSREGMW